MARIFLDSGAYSAMTHKKEIVLQDYINFIKANLDAITTYANLDVIRDPVKTWENQEEMERQGLSPLPVYHLDESDYYLERALQYDYLAVGGLTLKGPGALRYHLDKFFQRICPEQTQHYPIKKVHGFGITAPELVVRYPWYSIDSTSWVAYGKYGIILVPHYDSYTGEFQWNKPPDALVVSMRSKATDDEHLIYLREDSRRKFYEAYIESKGFRLGFSEYEDLIPTEVEKMSGEAPPPPPPRKLNPGEAYTNRKTKDRIERVVDIGLCNNHELRDQFNLLFFLDMERNQPPWPWPWLESGVIGPFDDSKDIMIQCNIKQEQGTS